MKTTLLFLSFVLSANLFGQTHFVGFKGGINFADYYTYSSNELQEINNRNGFSGGLTYEYHFNQRINCGMDLLYAQRGADLISSDASYRSKLDYLSLPIKGGILFGDLFSVFTNLGVIPSYLIYSKINTFNEFGYGSAVNDFTSINRFDCAALIEIGANYKVTSSLFIHTTLGYQRTFTDTDNGNLSFIYAGYRNEGIVLHFGIKYALNAE